MWVGIGYFLPKIIIVRVTGSEAPFHLTALSLSALFLAKLKVRPSPFTAIGRWGWRPCRGECVLGYPSTDAPRTRDPSVALAGATRRCFALLGAFPAQRDEATTMS